MVPCPLCKRHFKSARGVAKHVGVRHPQGSVSFKELKKLEAKLSLAAADGAGSGPQLKRKSPSKTAATKQARKQSGDDSSSEELIVRGKRSRRPSALAVMAAANDYRELDKPLTKRQKSASPRANTRRRNATRKKGRGRARTAAATPDPVAAIAEQLQSPSVDAAKKSAPARKGKAGKKRGPKAKQAKVDAEADANAAVAALFRPATPQASLQILRVVNDLDDESETGQTAPKPTVMRLDRRFDFSDKLM